MPGLWIGLKPTATGVRSDCANSASPPQHAAVRFGVLGTLVEDTPSLKASSGAINPPPTSVAMTLETPPGVSVDPAFMQDVQAAVPQVIQPRSIYETLLKKRPLMIRVCDRREDFFVGLSRLDQWVDPAVIEADLKRHGMISDAEPEKAARFLNFVRSMSPEEVRPPSPDVLAFCTPGGNRIMMLNPKGTGQEGQTVGILRHELSHAVDFECHPPEVRRWSDLPQFRAALKKDMRAICERKILPLLYLKEHDLVIWPDAQFTHTEEAARLGIRPAPLRVAGDGSPVKPGQRVYDRPESLAPYLPKLAHYFVPHPQGLDHSARELFGEVLAALHGGGGYRYPQQILDLFPTTAQWLQSNVLSPYSPWTPVA